MMLIAAHRPDDAVVHLNAAAQLMPHNPDVQFDLGVFLSQRGQPQEAAGHFRAALRERPDFPEAERELSAILNAHPDLR
jgi:Flp pilus assembly protein TadD